MYILITYDVSTETKSGSKRLRKIAKECTKYGQRVQNSVFECNLTNQQFLILRSSLLKIYNEKEDSLRIYKLGDKYQNKIESYGIKKGYDPEGILII